MALNEPQAAGMAKDLLVAMAQSGSLKTAGALITTGSNVETNTYRGTMDAAYLTSLYRNLVKGLQE